MPRAKKPPETAVRTASAVNGDLHPHEVLTLLEAAAYLKLPEGDVLRLVKEQALPARNLGNEWRFFKAAIQRWLSTPPQSNKEAWMSLAGIWKDDPEVEAELQEIYQRRGRPMTEDES